MTVCRRPVASWKPDNVGDSGLDRVGTENRCQKSRLRHSLRHKAPGQGLARVLGDRFPNQSSIASCLHTGRGNPQNRCRSGSSDTSFVGWRSRGPASAPLSTRRRGARRCRAATVARECASARPGAAPSGEEQRAASVAETLRPMAVHQGSARRKNGDTVPARRCGSSARSRHGVKRLIRTPVSIASWCATRAQRITGWGYRARALRG